MLPAAGQHGARVELQQARHAAQHGRRHAQLLAPEPRDGGAAPRGGGVEAVVVPRGEVCHHLVQAGAPPLQQLLGPEGGAGEEGGEAVLHALHPRPPRPQLPRAGEAPVTGPHQPRPRTQRPPPRAQPPPEEGGEAGVAPGGGGGGLGDAAAEHGAVEEDGGGHQGAGGLGLRQLAEGARYPDPGQRAVQPHLNRIN